MMHEIESTTHALSEYEIKNGVTSGILKSYGEFKISLFYNFFNFWHICARADFEVLARAYYVIIGRERLEIS